MNKTKAFSKAVVIIAMVLSLPGCILLKSIIESYDTPPQKTTSGQPASAETASYENTGNSNTNSLQIGNEDNLGVPNSIPSPTPFFD